jgi:hypothetical protein
LFIHSQHASDIDFSAYHSYAWLHRDRMKSNPVFLKNPELAGLINTAVDRQLTAKGFEKTSAAAADFLVAVNVRVREVTVISSLRNQGWSHGYDRSAIGNTSSATEMNKMSEGTLILEIIDRASEGIVWQSQAAGVIAGRDAIAPAVDTAVARMLESFPPES